MWEQMLTIVFFLLSGLAVSLRKFYLESPALEPASSQASSALKRRSVKSTKRVHILSGLLIAIAVITYSLFAVMMVAYLPKIAYLPILALSLFYVFFYLPGKNSSRLIMDLAGLLTPLFIGLLNKTKKQTKSLEKRFSDSEKSKTIARQLTKSEIIEMLNQQKLNYDGRSLAHGLSLAINFLDLASKRVEDYMLPLTDVHLVGIKETAGPILIDELHKSGYQTFPVIDKDQGIIGTVRLSDLVDLNEGNKPISEVLSRDLQYLFEEDMITSALEAFAETGVTMYIVKNSSQNIGILYLEDMIARIME